ncbi:hypothetical protein MVES1_000137 [Malassezia vespertilionis]|uniref:Uncharacterized protein n=1 Tax=Malassezia vespertilionis TaxID=2020962 RepID=A0A2N1JFK9_9BASI|nr:uncharacterized protein MVES1_000137 [Malassezia vespertilionis]PKI85341.1 hypothetical protein MVES_000136 [Malassezia vespertilionis]WFD04813.1 hypothetical protein MVES1_000137 [Malassezia vespertilionis]
MHHLSNLKCNATGLAPEHSMVLPEREVTDNERPIMNMLDELYTQFDEQRTSIFAPDVMYTMPNGNVIVGRAQVVQKLRERAVMHPGRTVSQRLLQTPESLPVYAMVVDQVVSCENEAQLTSGRNLLVLKRRVQDGLVTSITEEEGHRKATVPLAARAGMANVFCSPTDKMVSPCTSKLNLTKKRHYMKAKPTNLFASMTSTQSSF